MLSLGRRHARALSALLTAIVLAATLRVAAAASGAGTVPQDLLQGLRWRLIGPFRAGWATTATGVPKEPLTFYFGAAGGGVWRTTNAGQTWRPLMQHESAAAIGALAVSPSNPAILYAGTGQEGARYDLMPGDGVYRSDDRGESWKHVGLEDTRHIGAILVDPADPNRVLVAAIGHAFGPNSERGVYLTTDGGRRWQPVLQPGDSVGAVDLAWDPERPRVVYAALWQRHMHPWLDYFQPQAGPGSGIYRSRDRGVHWSRLAAGLPAGPLGRIGLAVARGSAGRIAYATVAVAAARRSEGGTSTGAGLYRTGDWGEHWRLVNPDPALANSYFGRLTVAPDDSNTVCVMGQSIRRSTDGGAHFEVMRGSPGGDDYHQLWIDPSNPHAMIAASDQGAAVSLDGGQSWSSWYNQPTGQFYHLAADEQFPYHIYSGQQDNGTVEIASRGDYGAIEERDWHPVGGDERDYMVPKPGDPRIVFGSGLGGTVSRFDEATHQSANVSPWPIGSYGARPTTVRYRYGWITPLAISPLPPRAMYFGAQVLFRSRDDGDHWNIVSPDLTGRRPGASACEDPDPLAARDCGFGVISAIAPSPLAAGRIWVGTDDGSIQVTSDGGASWRNVTPPELPPWGIVFALEASPFDPGTAYAAADLHRLDRHEPLLLRTHDGGRSWRRITRGIPGDEFTSVVRADPGRAGLLYAGTNRAVYVSFDDGDSWQPLSLNLPTTWIRDLLPHQGDLIAATQGRGIWVLDDVAPLREAGEEVTRHPAYLFEPAPAVRLRGSESHDTPWPPETPLGENPPTGAVVDYWLREPITGPVTLTIADHSGVVVRRFTSSDPPESLAADRYFESEWLKAPRVLSATAGMHRFVWDLRYARPPAPSYHYSIAAVRTAGTPVFPAGPLVLPGSYRVTLAANGQTLTRPLEVRLDPRVHVSPQALREQLETTMALDSLLVRAMSSYREIQQLRTSRSAELAPAQKDSLAQIADHDEASLAGVARTMAGLATSLQEADAAPTQGLREALTACRDRLEALVERWRRVASAIPERGAGR